MLYRTRVAAGERAFDKAQADAAARLSDLLDRVADWSPGVRGKLKGRAGPGEVGVYLHGAPGRGKSMLMDLFFEAAPVKAKRRVHFHAFMQDVHARLRAARETQPGDPIPPVAKALAGEAWLLCFDELQVDNPADAAILGRLFEALFERGVVVVATSNRQPDDLYDGRVNRHLFTPLIALLKARMELVELDAKRDYRRGGQEAEAWFAPLGPEADARMDAAWRAVVGEEPERAETLKVLGRMVTVPRAATGAARFSFDALCAAALGPADYLALAARYPTLFLDRIPRLQPQNRNEAQRFITLIDGLYEAKVRLVASADAEPDGLYPEGDGAKEFERTASRLMEMRSAAYLAAGRGRAVGDDA